MKKSDSFSKKEFLKMTNEELRENNICNLFEKDIVNSVYSYYDRVIVMGARPESKKLDISSGEYIHAKYLLENRELGIINIGFDGVVSVDGKEYILKNKEALYIGKGKQKIIISSKDNKNPALFYMLSAPAHKEYETKIVDIEHANKLKLGTKEEINERVIYQLIHPSILDTCQLSMGITCLEIGSAWNTMPPHTHDRRTEVYLYFDMKKDSTVFHFMGEPSNTRSLVVHNNEAVINPPWSVHFGVGTSNYSFVWGMAGENKEFDDMDHIKISNIK
ncbi:5-dehydro-4-deoxy-D-glucuronate isomerase [Spiroplasma endosymbiont of Aspidapion aeneum]|uniref:5-dehydro-4-deoxy-D-glucuronate isomerase n=1 Tax=Spiroplasma endosymbiont of Aspidapion aeneum TaxID=3066276 RepID=UPI00313C98E3